MPRPPLGRSNGDDRRQRRKQGGAVGAAASKTQAERSGCWEPQPGCEAPLANRSSFVWPSKASFIVNSSALLQRAAAAEQRFLVKLLLVLVAGHYLLRHIELPAGSSELSDMPKAPPLGELSRLWRD